MAHTTCLVVNLVLLVAATKMLVVKAASAYLPCRPICLVLCLLLVHLMEWIFCKLILAI
jgi:hypothetical protein